MKITAKKSLGQNFLKDHIVLNKIVNACNVGSNDLVIEIGPGKGALTRKLKSYNCDIIAFEIDNRLKGLLSELEDDRTIIIFEDFMKVDLNKYIKKNYSYIHIIANIPYYITNPIIRKILESPIDITDITLMVQKEVAERLSSEPGHKSYGALTIFSNLDYKVIKLFDVSKESFDPIPKVDSAIVRFQKKNCGYNINNRLKFNQLINDSFKSKRKTLKNNLKGYDWKKISNILTRYGYNDMVRAEQIPIDLFVEISNKV